MKIIALVLLAVLLTGCASLRYHYQPPGGYLSDVVSSEEAKRKKP